MKQDKAITLIALVITIIVLLILAGISIATLTGENGILEKAKLAKEKTIKAEEEEALELIRMDLQMEKTIHNLSDDEFMKLYEEEIAKNNILSGSTLTKKEQTIQVVTKQGNVYEVSKDKVEFIEKQGQGETIQTVANLKEGEYVDYIDKNGTTRKSMVLYNNSSYGIQIITADTVEDVKLGTNKPIAENDIMSGWSMEGEDYNIAKLSYNDAINILNTRAKEYLNTTYASSARSVGSIPNNLSSEAGYYTRSDSWFASYNETLKDMDMNYETDYNQMQKLGIRGSNKIYWLASRYILPYSNMDYFAVRRINVSGELEASGLIYVYSAGNTNSNSFELGLRPVFTLKSGIKITGGAGTSDSPYTLGT